MNILYITNYPSPYRVTFFNELGKKSNLTVLFDENSEEQKHRNKEWFFNSYSHFEAVFLKKIKIGKWKVSLETFSWIKKNYDVVVIGTYSTPTAQLAIQYMKMHKVPFIIEVDGGFAKSGKGILEAWKKSLISSAAFWISPSECSDQYLQFYGAEKNKIIRSPFTSLSERDILKNVVKADEKKRLKRELGITSEVMILTVGQFIHRKGNDILIKAAHQLDANIDVYIIGGNPTEEYLCLIKEHKIESIKFLDFMKNEELNKYYMAADVFVFPTREDIWGLVINEAMAKGLPIISTNKCIAALELVKEEQNGYIIPVEEANILAQKINFLSGNKEILQSMAQASLNLIKGRTVDKMVDVHIETFKRMDTV